MHRIILLGWGWFSNKGNLQIDKEIIRLTWKERPKILYVPIWSRNDPNKILVFFEYWNWFWCYPQVLLIDKDTEQKDIVEAFEDADIIYFWWWDAMYLMKNIRKFWIEEIVKKLLNKKIFVWNSAWAMAFCKYWNASYKNDWDIIHKERRVKWMAIINILLTPHYSNNTHKKITTKTTMSKTPGICLWLDNNVAIEILNWKFRIIKWKNWWKAFKIFYKEWEYFEKEIKPGEELRLLETLTKK